LEATYLLIGPTNPELPLRVNMMRGIEQYRNEPEEIWGWLFYGKNIQDTIRLSAHTGEHKTVKLELSLREPTEYGYSTKKKHQTPADSSISQSTSGAPAELILKHTDEKKYQI
jgi:hypothetical protein